MSYSRHRLLPLLYTTLGLYLIFLLLRYPGLSLQYALTGLTLWFEKMIPTLLPFMILSGILISMNLTERFVRLLHPLLHCLYGTTPNGSYTMIMGFLCGFPMGARVAGELRRKGRLSREEAQLLLAFCNNIGPIDAFITAAASSFSCYVRRAACVRPCFNAAVCRSPSFFRKYRGSSGL